MRFGEENKPLFQRPETHTAAAPAPEEPDSFVPRITWDERREWSGCSWVEGSCLTHQRWYAKDWLLGCASVLLLVYFILASVALMLASDDTYALHPPSFALSILGRLWAWTPVTVGVVGSIAVGLAVFDFRNYFRFRSLIKLVDETYRYNDLRDYLQARLQADPKLVEAPSPEAEQAARELLAAWRVKLEHELKRDRVVRELSDLRSKVGKKTLGDVAPALARNDPAPADAELDKNLLEACQNLHNTQLIENQLSEWGIQQPKQLVQERA